MAEVVRFLLNYHQTHLSALCSEADNDILHPTTVGEGEDHCLRRKQ
jgi:hypothetical protein